MDLFASFSDWTINILTLVLHSLRTGVSTIVLSIAFSSAALSANRSILVLSDLDSNSQTNVINALKLQEPVVPGYETEFLSINDFSAKQLTQTENRLIITLGQQAALLTNNSKIPTINAMLPKQGLTDQNLCLQKNCTHSSLHYAIYLDQPLERQVNLVMLIFPNIKSIGVLASEFSADKLNPLKKEAAKRHITIKSCTIESTSELNRLFNELILESDVLLALPDPLIHNRKTVPYLLLSSYRFNIPVIGFSKSYVNAGAIAAVFSSPEQIALHIRDLAKQILSPNKPQKRIFPPKYFSVNINKNVARSLELHLDEAEDLKLKLLHLEK